VSCANRIPLRPWARPPSGALSLGLRGLDAAPATTPASTPSWWQRAGRVCRRPARADDELRPELRHVPYLLDPRGPGPGPGPRLGREPASRASASGQQPGSTPRQPTSYAPARRATSPCSCARPAASAARSRPGSPTRAPARASVRVQLLPTAVAAMATESITLHRRLLDRRAVRRDLLPAGLPRLEPQRLHGLGDPAGNYGSSQLIHRGQRFGRPGRRRGGLGRLHLAHPARA